MKFEKIEGFLLKQFTGKPVAISAIKFSVLRNIVKFTSREPQYYDPFDPYKKADIVLEEVTNNYYQRLENDDRIKEIYNYLIKEINNLITNKSIAIGTFPTSVILSMDINEDFNNSTDYETFITNLSDNKNENEIYGAYLEESKKYNIDLIIPYNKISLIVDGQHRIAGMLKLYNDAVNDKIKIGRNRLTDEYPALSNAIIIDQLENFSFGATLLIGFDLWEQGKVFADVNFNQKPVNKSLYYDIFGSLPNPDKNDIFLAHMLAMHLNNNEDSPLKGFIKMLGTGKGYFSQAFFVEALLTLFKPKNIWSSFPLDYLSGGEKHKLLPKFLKAYFNVIKRIFSDYWPKPIETSSWTYKHILAKTTGMGALMRLLQPIYQSLNRRFDLYNISQRQIEDEIEKILIKIKDKGREYFSKDGNYSGAGSNGLQANLYKTMVEDIKKGN